MSAPLKDLMVVEVASYIAGPSAGAMLADLGATVIKVEPPSGDPLRGLMPPARIAHESSYFDASFDVENRGKHSITLDLKDQEDRQHLHRLVEKADVFLCSMLHARQRQFGICSEELKRVNPLLIHATLTGYSGGGPDENKPGFDTTAFFASTGLTDRLRDSEDSEPPWPAPAQGDHTAALSLALGIMTALRARDEGQCGQTVETSLFETAIWTQSLDYAVRINDPNPPMRQTRFQVVAPTSNRYRCGDGKWLVLTMPMPSAWARLCSALDQSQWLKDERYVDAASRKRNMAELVSQIDRIFLSRTRAEWGRLLDEQGLAWAPILTQNEVAESGQAAAIDMFPPIQHPIVGSYRTVRLPFRIAGQDLSPQQPAPSLGQHNSVHLDSTED